MIDYIIVGMVLHEPLTGYDIKKEIETSIGSFYKASYGSLYPALKKLTDKGHLVLTEQTQVERLKKYYRATDLGKAAFMEWLASPIDINAGTASVLAKIFFFGELPKDIRHQRLHECELEIQRVYAQYMEMEKQFADSIESDNHYFEFSTLYYGLQTAHGLLRWLGHIKEQKSFAGFIKEE